MLKTAESLVPLIVFFVLFHLKGIYIATAGLMLSYTCFLLYRFLLGHKIASSEWFVWLAVIIFGAATLYFQNDLFIKWKPTFVFWSLAVVIISTNLASKMNASEWLLQEKVLMDSKYYRILDYLCVIFFIFLGLLNVCVFTYFDSEVWVNFKVFGIMILTLLFAVVISSFVVSNAREINME